MWIILIFIGFILCAISVIVIISTKKDGIIFIGFMSYAIGVAFIVISIILINVQYFDTKKYKCTTEIRTTILNDSITKCDTFYVITPK